MFSDFLQDVGLMEAVDIDPGNGRPVPVIETVLDLEQFFFLDMLGHINDPPVANALDELKARAQFIKILGSYPRSI